MKKILITFLTVLLAGCATQKPVTVVPTNYDISDNLDLEAVASIFGDSRDLEDFEYRLNDPKIKISNLDLNEDGNVDYLRVVETVESGIHFIAIQAAIGNDLFQDVATIEIERDSFNKPQIQFIGHPYFYGPSYIVQPFYYRMPIFVGSFWAPNYVIWQSPYYFGSYPSFYSYWRPFPVRRYITHVHVYKNKRNTYKYVPGSRRTAGTSITRDISRNDYVKKRPTQTFETRNRDIRNKRDLDQSRNNRNSSRNRIPRSTEPRKRGTIKRGNSTPRTNRSSTKRNETSTRSIRKTEKRKPSKTPTKRKSSSSTKTRKKNSKNPRNQ